MSRQPRAAEAARRMLVIDTSGSMGEPAWRPSAGGRQPSCHRRPDDVKVGLVIVRRTRRRRSSRRPRPRATVQSGVDGLRPRARPPCTTAMQLAVQRLGTRASRNIILLSDGGDTGAEHDGRAAAAAGRVQRSGARAGGRRRSRTDESQNSVLTSLATAGDGGLVAAGDAGALRSAFERCSPRAVQPGARHGARSGGSVRAAVRLGAGAGRSAADHGADLGDPADGERRSTRC